MRLFAEPFAHIEFAALVQEPMVCGDEDVVDVRVRQFLRDGDECVDRAFTCAEYFVFVAFVAFLVDLVMVDVQHITGFHQFTCFAGVHRKEVLGLDGMSVACLQDGVTVTGATGGMVIDQNKTIIQSTCGFRIECDSFMGEQRCHTELRIGRQHAKLCVH